MNQLNSVVIKLWLTIIFIVTTVLILLSAALITFIQSYFTQETEDSLLKDAKRISQLLESADNRETAIQHSRKLIEGPVGLIIMNDKHIDRQDKDKTKNKMVKEIKKSNDYNQVFNNGKQVSEHVTLNMNGNQRTYVLIGYPTKAISSADNHTNKFSGVFIYQDLKTIEDTNNVITVIILIIAIIFLAITTIFAFFLSSRITKPLRNLRTQALKVSKGDYAQVVPVNSRDEIGELSRAFNTMSSEIQQHIDALSSSKNIRDSLINSMVEGVLGFNDKKEIIISNKMANTTLQMLDDFALEKLDEQNELTFKNKKTQFEVYEINTRYFVIITSYIEQIQPDGRSGIVAIIRDMTNEHNMDQMKKDFIANVSHELRTPISLLQGYTESIVDGIVTEPAEIHESLSIVLDETKRLNRLVNELLNVARMDAEGLTVKKVVQPIDHLLDKVQQKYQKHAKDLGLNMNLSPNTHNQMWYYDSDRIEQVLTNLIDNASRYTEPGDEIKIEFGETQTENILYISDTGSGIAPEHLQQVFDRFYKVDTARKRGKQGTGLGLFICRMIIHEHGGTIDVKSTLGKGTTFIITLPKPKTN
ncbi:histidine kinase [Staphylococcus saprophyticus]|jgi:two-component system sensor histidine kinase ResE|uniref:ATP-binding protein n=1 Tax=Staphylococcus TaxID=1279 RepID=UPI000647971A|nr:MULTISPECIES: ATP-binding protein [Staphylococcus]AMG21067.1 HAMP domain-containing protein [Staphylococcus saprophyticus]AMG34544.1 HAMP domain-containing protein [Staphylococcus saprophyticus]MBM0844476.1 HAMP domain-containing protein [Staphylococcus saprophyticus]MDK1671527.1 ATP-binding protein [Staphylococcus saprophyticus]MDW3788863.1 ATP-binding protein [Staphylococcus saprophyticus]